MLGKSGALKNEIVRVRTQPTHVSCVRTRRRCFYSVRGRVERVPFPRAWLISYVPLAHRVTVDRPTTLTKRRSV